MLIHGTSGISAATTHMGSATLHIILFDIQFLQEIGHTTKIEIYQKYNRRPITIQGDSLTVCIGSASTSHA